MTQRPTRDDPHKIGWSAHVLCVCTSIRECSSLRESRDVLADLGSHDVLSDLSNVSREITPQDGACKRGIIHV